MSKRWCGNALRPCPMLISGFRQPKNVTFDLQKSESLLGQPWPELSRARSFGGSTICPIVPHQNSRSFLWLPQQRTHPGVVLWYQELPVLPGHAVLAQGVVVCARQKKGLELLSFVCCELCVHHFFTNSILGWLTSASALQKESSGSLRVPQSHCQLLWASLLCLLKPLPFRRSLLGASESHSPAAGSRGQA